ncbi:hypothetical protein BCF74_13221 [Knoellia remsis]|uniref:Uncharacterized protein n=1 Tax=Knoellia remsis TaxID=407159 RepID=A0A2T0U3N8_9MICO|nr:hypothetical protein BCF74_13221 [Knoellia remsis]
MADSLAQIADPAPTFSTGPSALVTWASGDMAHVDETRPKLSSVHMQGMAFVQVSGL